MADGSNFSGNQPTRDRHAIGDYRAHLLAEVQPGAEKQPRLSIHYHKNKLTLEVRTNVPSDMNGRERGIIRGEMDPHIFFSFLKAFHSLIKSPPTEKPMRLNLKRPDFQKNNGGEPVTECQVVFGRNNEGVVFMSLLSMNKERPRIMFPFHPGKWAEFIGTDGSPLSAAQASEFIALGYLEEWEEIVPHYVYDRYVAESFDKPGNGGGGGNYQRAGGNYQQRGGGGGGGNYQQRQPASGGGEDMRTEARQPESNDWDALPF